MEYVLAALIGYFLGCSNMAYYISLLKRVDLRKNGTGNYGTSNALIQMGWKAGALVFVHDVGKGALAVILARSLFKKAVFAPYLAGLFVVIGHVFSCFLKFKGGKGFAPYGGATLALDPAFGFTMLAIVIVICFVCNYVIVGNYATIISYPLYLFAKGNFGGAVFALLMGALIAVKHIENIKRIKGGSEKKFRDAIFGKKTNGSPSNSIN